MQIMNIYMEKGGRNSFALNFHVPIKIPGNALNWITVFTVSFLLNNTVVSPAS